MYNQERFRYDLDQLSGLIPEFRDYHHAIPAAATERELMKNVPEDIIREIIEKEVSDDPGDPKYDYLVYRCRGGREKVFA